MENESNLSYTNLKEHKEDQCFSLLPEDDEEYEDEELKLINENHNMEQYQNEQENSTSESIDPKNESYNAQTRSANLEIFERYTQTIMSLQKELDQDLGKNIAANSTLNNNKSIVRKEKSCLDESGMKLGKVKFKNLAEHKRDNVLKKLLKTIDVMNQELNKRDLLVKNLERENELLNREKYNESIKEEILRNSANNKDICFMTNELHKLKQEIADERKEKEILKTRLIFAEKEILEMKFEEAVDFKEFPHPKENIKKLQSENEELNNLNNFLKSELDKLTKQMELLERKKDLEVEINGKFESLARVKATLETENKSLKKELGYLKEEMKNELLAYNARMFESQTKYENQIDEFKKIVNDLEFKSKDALKNLELLLKEAHSNIDALNQEKSLLFKTINSISNEKESLSEQMEKQKSFYEKKFENLKYENDKQKDSLDSLNKLNFEQQKQIQKLLKDIEDKHANIEKQSVKKCDELKRLKQSVTLANDKLKYQQLKHESEVDELRKKFSKDLDHLKFSTEQTSSRNGELSKSNTELRAKVKQLEHELKEVSDKFNILKHNYDSTYKLKKDVKEEHERVVFELKKEIDTLVQVRDEYLKKNNSQQVSIEKMLEQISHFQKEFEVLVKQNTSLNEKIKKLAANCDAYKKKYAQMKTYLKKLWIEEEKIKKLKEQQQLINQQQQLQHSQQANLIASTQAQANLIDNLVKNLDLLNSIDDNDENIDTTCSFNLNE